MVEGFKEELPEKRDNEKQAKHRHHKTHFFGRNGSVVEEIPDVVMLARVMAALFAVASFFGVASVTVSAIFGVGSVTSATTASSGDGTEERETKEKSEGEKECGPPHPTGLCCRSCYLCCRCVSAGAGVPFVRFASGTASLCGAWGREEVVRTTVCFGGRNGRTKGAQRFCGALWRGEVAGAVRRAGGPERRGRAQGQGRDDVGKIEKQG